MQFREGGRAMRSDGQKGTVRTITDKGLTVDWDGGGWSVRYRDYLDGYMIPIED